MNTTLQKISDYWKNHKTTIIITLLILILSGYYGYKKYYATILPLQYSTQAAQKTTITISVSGSGQVSELNKIDLKPLSSGAIITTGVKNADTVKMGQVIATIDQSNSKLAVLQARSSLANAEANLKKLITGTSAEDLRISQNNVSQAEANYKNALTSLDNTKLAINADDALAKQTLETLQSNSAIERLALLNSIEDKIASAKNSLDSEAKIFTDTSLKDTFSVQDANQAALANTYYNQAQDLIYKAYDSLATAKTNPTDEQIKQISNETITALNTLQASLNHTLSALRSSIASAKFSQASLDSYKSTISSQISSTNSNTLSIQTSIQNLWDKITAAKNNLTATNLASTQKLTAAQNQITSTYNSWQSAKDQLAKLKIPTEKQDIFSAQAQVASAQAQLADAQNTFNNTIITAPFDGQVAELNVQKGDQVGPSTIIATLITKQQVANIPLNEVDVSKIKLGMPATLTFDAIDTLSISGKVIDIDTLGTVTQGVVTYNAKISFDTIDGRVKPGMSVNAIIITEAKTDALAIPNSALKTDSNGSYIQKLDASSKPQNIYVQTGIANDSITEITAGLTEGESVITQTIDPNKAAVTAQSSGAGFRLPGVGGGRN